MLTSSDTFCMQLCPVVARGWMGLSLSLAPACPCVSILPRTTLSVFFSRLVAVDFFKSRYNVPSEIKRKLNSFLCSPFFCSVFQSPHDIGAPCLPCCCCGPKCECDGCAIMKIQLQAFCLAITGAFPCDEEVPPVLTILGCTLYPKCTCCAPQKEIIKRG